MDANATTDSAAASASPASGSAASEAAPTEAAAAEAAGAEAGAIDSRARGRSGRGKDVWAKVGAGALVASRLAGRALLRVGRGASAAYHAVDPDLRRHIAQLPILGLTMFGPGRRRPEPLPDDGHRPLVFVHGLGGAPGNFLPMQSYAWVLGRRRSYALRFAKEERIDAMAEELCAFVAEVLAVNGCSPEARVDVVAHSMGGLVSRVALDDPATAARVANLVTFGTPHGGTHAARFAHTPHTLDMRPDSALMKRLRAQLPWRGPPEMPRLVAFWSEADMMLLPATTACVEGAESIEMTGYTHNGYLLYPEAWRLALAELSG